MNNFEDKKEKKLNILSSSKQNINLPAREFFRIKIISMGEAATGKSCLIKRYCEKQFVKRYIPTIGVDFGVKTVNINNSETKVNFWDLSGHEEFFEVRNEFYNNTQGAILVFDVTRRETFEALEKWIAEARNFTTKDFVIFVVANKIDNKKRFVSKEESEKWARENGYVYFETSAMIGTNVDDMFELLFRTVEYTLMLKRKMSKSQNVR